MKLPVSDKKVIKLRDWDELVKETYGRPYSFQQQDGCQDRGMFELTVPDEEAEDFENSTVPEIVNDSDMGVSFAAWLARDPKQPLPNEAAWALDLWWGRNFYPNVQTVANDLHAKGLLDAGEYLIEIDW